jgi:hypothetical protein
MKGKISFKNFPADLWALSGVPLIVICFLVYAVFLLQGWLWFVGYGVALLIAIIGAVLIGRAKLPLYRRGHFFTFGIRHIPEALRSSYRWGCWLSVIGIALALLLLLTSPLRKSF